MFVPEASSKEVLSNRNQLSPIIGMGYSSLFNPRTVGERCIGQLLHKQAGASLTHTVGVVPYDPAMPVETALTPSLLHAHGEVFTRWLVK